MAVKAEDLPDLLVAACARHMECPSAVENLNPLSGGASADTWSFDALFNQERKGLILRLSPAGKRDPIRIDRKSEALLQLIAGKARVPVAPVLFILDEDDGLGMGYVMERIDGETIARRILSNGEYTEARKGMARQCGEILARIHSIEMNALPPLQELPADKILKTLYALYASFKQDHPVLEYAFRWLKDHLPEEKSLGLVHGDFRNGNFIVGAEGIRAVLDWELAHLGDPMEDLGWICVNSWRFGNIELPVGGFGTREQLFEAYEAAGGERVDMSRVHFWEVFGTLKWGFACILQGFTHLRGAKRSVELAAIGRRVSETEIDLLNLLT